MSPLIDIRNITKTYTDSLVPTHALKGATFAIESGEFIAIMGPSGSGKSTLLHILSFLDRQSTGTYRFNAKSIDEYTDDDLAYIRNKKMGFVFQSFNLLPRATVYDNVRLPLLYSNIPEKEWRQRAEEAIDAVGLAHRMRHDSSALSGGEKQRAAIARAIVCSPDVIFADEPTGNLDSKSGQVVMEIIQNLNKDGKTIILITHETYTAEYAERIIKMFDGAVESDKKVAKRRTNTKAFFK